MRIQAFDYFRAIAILFIVAGHSIGTWNTSGSILEGVFHNLIAGGTSLFVFISGFFFHYVFYQRFQYSKFMIKKIQNVFLPYLFLTLLLLLSALLANGDFPSSELYFSAPLAGTFDYLRASIFYIFNVGTVTGHWYVPFVMMIFLASPMFIFFIKLNAKLQIITISIALLISMLIHRPEYNMNPFHSLIYFSSVYLIGIFVSINHEKVMYYLKGKALLLLLLVLLLSFCQTIFYEKIGNFHKLQMVSYSEIDIMILQKIVMCFFFISLLSRFEDTTIPSLKKLADMSFAIFFLHGVALIAIQKIVVSDTLFIHLNGPVLFLFQFFSALVLSIVAAYVVKYFLHCRSRYLIGW